jgi:hypothetical protein
MSLKPSEQKALTAIEHALRSTDRRLAATLATFAMLTADGRVPRWKCLSPWRLRLRRHLHLLLAMAAVCTVVIVVVLAGLLSPARSTPSRGCSVARVHVPDCYRTPP